jgi:hypothetical protein
MLQMVGRFRKLADVPIEVLVDDYECVFKDGVVEDAQEFMKDRRRLSDAYKAVLNSDVSFRDGKLQWAPDYLSKMFIFADAERHQDQLYVLYSEARQKGWNVFADPGGRDAVRHKKIVIATQNVKDAKEELLSDSFDRVAACENLDKEIEIREERRQQQTSTKEDKAFLDVAYVYKHYPGGALTKEYLAFATKNREQIRRFTLLSKDVLTQPGGSDILIRSELNSIQHSAYVDVSAKMFILQGKCIGECLTFFGHKAIHEFYGELLPMETFAEHEWPIIKLCDDSRIAGNRRVPRETERELLPGEGAVIALRRELYGVWEIDLTRVRNGKNNTVIGYRWKRTRQ